MEMAEATLTQGAVNSAVQSTADTTQQTGNVAGQTNGSGAGNVNTGQDDAEHIRVPRKSIAEYETWDNLAGFGKTVQQWAGKPWKEVKALMEAEIARLASGEADTTQQSTQATQQQTQDQQQTQSQPLTAEQIEAILDKREQKAAKAQQEAQTQQQRAAAEQTARQDRDAWYTSAAKELFPPDKDGKQPPIAGKISALLERELIGIMVDDMPEWQRTHKDAQEHLNRAVNYTKATDAQKAKALKAVQDVLADFTTTARSQFASGQANTPAATLAGGAGGRQDNQLSAKDDPAAVKAAIVARLEARKAGRR
jgi:hypothetical protein